MGGIVVGGHGCCGGDMFGGDNAGSREENLLEVGKGREDREVLKLGAPQSQQIHERLRPANPSNAPVKPPTQLTWYQPP